MCVADVLVDRVGLTGEKRLVDFEGRRLDQLPVDDDLVARPEFDDVVEDHVVRRPRSGSGLPAHHRFCLANDGELVQRLLGAQLLNDADRAVRDDQ